MLTNEVRYADKELSSLRSQLECWNAGIVESWVLASGS
jgi:hypothetical protein